MSDTERDIAEIKATLARLEPMLSKLLDGQAAMAERLARVEGRIEEMPTARDFGALEGRIAEQSSILQVAIASRMGRSKPAAEQLRQPIQHPCGTRLPSASTKKRNGARKQVTSRIPSTRSSNEGFGDSILRFR